MKHFMINSGENKSQLMYMRFLNALLRKKWMTTMEKKMDYMKSNQV